MKNLKTLCAKCICFFIFNTLHNENVMAQNQMDSFSKKPGIALIDFDTRGYNFNNQEAIQFVIFELITLSRFEFMDKYEVEYNAKTDNLTPSACFSKVCLT